MAIYDGDQQQTRCVVINGVHVNATAAVIKTVAPATSVYTFTANYAHVVSGVQLSYRKGQSYILDASLKATLLALSAPMVVA